MALRGAQTAISYSGIPQLISKFIRLEYIVLMKQVL
jgi:hypothetical protein